MKAQNITKQWQKLKIEKIESPKIESNKIKLSGDKQH